MRICTLWWLPLALVLSTTACGRKSDTASNQGAPREVQLMAEKRAAADGAASERLLSYKHMLTVEVAAGQVEAGLKALQAACQAVPQQGCVVMRSNQSEGRHADIYMNLRRQAVEGLRAQAVGFGKLTTQTTTAEDMTGPITDVSRRLTMQKALRDDLLELRKQSRGNIEALIKATEKLAEVQASIEGAEGDLATFRNRIAMDELSINLNAESSAYRDDHHPVADALKNFGSNVADGLGALIQFLALAAPWFVLIAVLPFIWRGLRRIWKLGRR